MASIILNIILIACAMVTFRLIVRLTLRETFGRHYIALQEDFYHPEVCHYSIFLGSAYTLRHSAGHSRSGCTSTSASGSPSPESDRPRFTHQCQGSADFWFLETGITKRLSFHNGNQYIWAEYYETVLLLETGVSFQYQ